MESVASILNNLSYCQRRMLEQYIDNHQPFIITRDQDYTRSVLIRKGLIKPEPHVMRPRYTRMTDLGRQVLCAMLAHSADMLKRAELIAELPDLAKFKKRPPRGGPVEKESHSVEAGGHNDVSEEFVV